MNKYLIIVFLMLTLSCRKHDDYTSSKAPVLAGIADHDMDSFNPEMDIVPQQTGCLIFHITDSIDIDKDNKMDFQINLHLQQPDFNGVCCNYPAGDSVIFDCFPVGIKSRYLNVLSEIYQIKTDENKKISLLHYGDTITNKGTWSNGSNLLFYYNSFPCSGNSAGYWENVKDGYVGIRKISDKDTCYGWITIDMNDTCKVKLMSIRKK